MQRFKTGSFTERLGSTIGVDFSMKTLEIDGKRVKVIYWELISLDCLVNLMSFNVIFLFGFRFADFYFRCDRFGLVDSIVQLLSSYRIFDSICFTIYFAICFTICFIDCFTYCVADCLTFWSSFCFCFTTFSFTFTTLSCKCGIQLVKKGSEQSLRVTTGARRVLS